MGRWTTNIFNGIKAEVIDFSGVTDWPVNEDGLASVDANAFYTYEGPDFTGIQKVVLPKEVQAIGVCFLQVYRPEVGNSTGRAGSRPRRILRL